MSFHYSSSGATLFRAFYIHDLTATVNFARKFEIRPFIKIYTNIRLDRVAYPITCSTIELGTGIIFASVPSLKPFMQFFTSTEKKFDTSYNQSGRDAERTGTGHYYTMEVLKSTAGHQPTRMKRILFVIKQPLWSVLSTLSNTTIPGTEAVKVKRQKQVG
jgi:hypothetical protein